MKAKVKATDEIIEVEEVDKNIFGRTDGIVALYSKDTLDFNLPTEQEAAVIEGWLSKLREALNDELEHHVLPSKIDEIVNKVRIQITPME